MSGRVALLVFIVLAVISLSSHAQVYKWADNEGRTHFSDSPPVGDHASNVEEISISPAPQQRLNQKSNNVDLATEKASRRKVSNRKNKKVIMYGTSWCSYCDKARKYFENEGIRYVEYDVEKSGLRMREFKKLGGTGYPLILVGKDQKIQGFNVVKFLERYNN